jgi:hypothetical protein
MVDVKPDEEMQPEAKVLLLLEGYLYMRPLFVFSLIADTNYIVQNVVRLMRGMFEIALQRRVYATAKECLRWTIRLGKRMLEQHSFARQFASSANVSLFTSNRGQEHMGYLKEDVLMVMESQPDKFTLIDIFEEDKIFVIKTLGSPAYVFSMPHLLVRALNALSRAFSEDKDRHKRAAGDEDDFEGGDVDSGEVQVVGSLEQGVYCSLIPE